MKNEVKIDLVIDAYLNLSDAINRAGGDAYAVITNYKNKTLDEFIKEVCATNGIKFTPKKMDNNE